MSRQQAIHIIRHERSWTETCGTSPKKYTLTNTYFWCGKIWKTVKDPDDLPPTAEEIEKAKILPVCKKCRKTKDAIKLSVNEDKESR